MSKTTRPRAAARRTTTKRTTRRTPAKSSGVSAPPRAEASNINVYSYIRFSTPEQAEGDSERRQIEAARQWAERHGYTFDESLKADRGRSAYTGAHRKKGHFGKFLERVKSGDVPRGSILVVEELRRLTREGLYVGLREIFEKLWDADITIQTLVPECRYTRAECERNIAASVSLTILLQLAREESEQKSRWLREAWDEKRRVARDSRELLTRIVPKWITVTAKGKRQALPQAVRAIRQMFRRKERRQGSHAIAVALNKSAGWSPNQGWTVSYINKTLANREVLGEYQPHQKIDGQRIPDGDPIEGYFPRIIPGELFDHVQQILAETSGQQKGGRNDKARNVLQHLCRCGYCDSPMHLHQGAGDYQYIFCPKWRSGRGECRKPAPAMKYAECEAAILQHCRRLRPDQVLLTPSASRTAEAALRTKLKRLAATCEANHTRIANLNNQIETTQNAQRRDYYEQRVIELEVQQREQEATITQLRQQLRSVQRAETTFEEWQANVQTLQEALKQDDVSVRRRLNSHLRDFIEKIEVFACGYRDEEDDFDDWLDAGETAADVQMRRNVRREFVAWAKSQRASKRGRFLRVYYKYSPARIRALQELFGNTDPLYFDVVPEGSWAGNASMGPLWDEFLKNRQKRAVR